MKWLSAPPQNFVSSKFKFPLRSVHKSLSNSAGQKKKTKPTHTKEKQPSYITWFSSTAPSSLPFTAHKQSSTTLACFIFLTFRPHHV